MIKMTTVVEIIVEFKIPDTTAITTYHLLYKLGYKNLRKLSRMEYYRFSIAGDFREFTNKIVKVDVLVNANKHNYFIQKNVLSAKHFLGDDLSIGGIMPILVLVKNDIPDKGVLSVLKNRLGFEQIKRMEKGILWGLYFDEGDNNSTMNISREIARRLLVNENYQSFEVRSRM